MTIMKEAIKIKSLPCRQVGVVQTGYDIVQDHDGEIKVESEERKGSTFLIALPN